MRLRTIVMATMAALLMAAATGCSKSAEDKLVGTWKLDEKALEGKKGAELVKSMSPELQFTEDGSMSMTTHNPMKPDADPQTKEGTYEVKGSEGDKLTLETDLDGQKKTMTVTFQSDDGMKLESPEQKMTMVLQRSS